jgi:SNF2 family DNA or RNA helicase
MKILHGTWIPDVPTDFVQGGGFYLWVETDQTTRRKNIEGVHPRHLFDSDLLTCLSADLGIEARNPQSLARWIAPKSLLLPTADGQPLPSLELSNYLETEPPDRFDWQYWQVHCYRLVDPQSQVTNVISLLKDLHFVCQYQLAEVQMGTDLLFWHHYSQALKQLFFKDQYIPALKYRQLAAAGAQATAKSAKAAQRRTQASSKPAKKRTASKAAAKAAPSYEIYAGWDWIGDRYETLIQTQVPQMPLACTAGFAEPVEPPQLYDRATLLHHFSSCLLTEIVTHTAIPQAALKKIEHSLIHDCLYLDLKHPGSSPAQLERYRQWQAWRDRLDHGQGDASFDLYFQLQEPARPEDAWEIQFHVAPKQDPSLRIALLDFWRLRERDDLRQQFGDDFERHLLINLGTAARIYPGFWRGLETDEPVGITVDLDTAFEFLKESAWVLEDAGYRVVVPAWWTPKGRQRAKVRLKAKGKSVSGNDSSKGYFSIDTLVQYRYELAIGDRPVSAEEWQQLVQAKAPLVQFRGQWMELDQAKMQQMLTFWQQHQQENPDLSLMEFMRLAADGDEDLEVEVDRDDLLATLLTNLKDTSALDLAPDPDTFAGSLRDYQKRGLSWLQYLERLGLNGCLADDMGLGKTVQVIARLAQERELAAQAGVSRVPPTLLICPTSVVGNWFHELHKFAPQLKAMIHHGGDRAKKVEVFQAVCDRHDLVITSFTLARKDAACFSAVDWHRIVLDEAQNIKNPKAAQTKAILKLSAPHRLALTGTPVENRLMDLWSIFNFLNPGYLGKQAQFRKQFELPIQRENDPRRSTTLKKLVEPFILRRLKTDQSIIKDLPDKVEQKVFCNLTPEQASLYEAVVKDVAGELAKTEGIQRKGMILATLTKLKQICNHPRQFLQDNSDFAPSRSHKLSRLMEMLQEVVEEGESALVFTQFTEIGAALEQHLRQEYRIPTHYLHGGVSRKQREQMIARFQDPDSEPSIFVLSLKAGGVGITLTQANHVFHFDRWWNPAVEDQATDRAFRIGQKKNVFVHKFVAIGTLEERIDQMIEDKKKLAGAIVGADESWLTELDNSAFQDLIALSKQAILE